MEFIIGIDYKTKQRALPNLNLLVLKKLRKFYIVFLRYISVTNYDPLQQDFMHFGDYKTV